MILHINKYIIMGNSNETPLLQEQKGDLPCGPYENEDVIIRMVSKSIYNDEVQIYGKSAYCDIELSLSQNHPDFINLYNKLTIGNIQNITYKSSFLKIFDPIIINIAPPLINNMCVKFKGFLDIVNEYPMLYDYKVIVTENNNIRLVIHKNQINNIIIGKKYKIHYQKWYNHKLYKIIEFQLCD